MLTCTECGEFTISTPGASFCKDCNPGTVPNGNKSECGE